MYAETDMEPTQKWVGVGISDLEVLAKEIVEKSGYLRILTFSGELGAGKTTLIKAICRALGVQDVVGSPTFSIVNEYRTFNNEPVFHFDCYRLNSEKQLNEIGMDEYLFSGNYCLIEWPEIVKSLLTENHVELVLTTNGTDRDIEMRIIK